MDSLTASTSTPSTFSAWVAASRPKTLTASLMPVLVGTVVAFKLQGLFSASSFLLTGAMALLIQIGINLVNDALDFRNGIDTDERIGLPRATHQGWLSFQQVFTGGMVTFALALLCALFLSLKAGWLVFAIALMCVLGGYLYSGGPYPLASLGLSDPAVLLFFGIVATTTTTYIQTGSWSMEAFIAGCQIGLLATSLSAINNFRDVLQDQRAGKKTVAVRFGLTIARLEICSLLTLPFILGGYWASHQMAIASMLPLLTLPLALQLAYTVTMTPPCRHYNALLARAALLLLLFSSLLSAGFLLY